MTTTHQPNFAVTPTSKHAANAIRLTLGGKPVEGAKVMKVCAHCFSPVYGGGLIMDGACTNGCGICDEEQVPA
jgi:hypothetical protein